MTVCYQTCEQWQTQCAAGEWGTTFAYLYGADHARQSARYQRVAAQRTAAFGARPFAFISAPGRTELSGNHTDHQRGRVLAGSVSVDILSAVAPNADGRIRILSEGYPLMELDAGDTRLRPEEANTTHALVRGVVKAFTDAGYQVGGFDAYMTSDIPQGSGLSSSAAYEVLIGTILNVLYNEGAIPDEQLALFGQYAENEYFKKPSGLMDQMACAVGGVVQIDFQDPAAPMIERIAWSFPEHALCVVNAGGSHADMTPEYASIPEEMRAVAAQLGATVLREVNPDTFYERLPALRETLPDRALLRALHFFQEDARVPLQAQALREANFPAYRAHMRASGYSSEARLQNIFPSYSHQERSVSLALTLAEQQLCETGAWRVHGGGFAGTIQALLPLAELPAFQALMERTFGAGAVYPLSIRPVGGYALG